MCKMIACSFIFSLQEYIFDGDFLVHNAKKDL